MMMCVFLRLADMIMAVLMCHGMRVSGAVVGVGDQVGMDVAVTAHQCIRHSEGRACDHK